MLISKKEVEVRYAETDQMGVVYHANYLVWMELGRTSLIKELGFNYAEMEKDGIISPVLDIQASYKKPLRYGETATVKTWIEEYDGFRSKYGYEILDNQGEVAVTGFSSHVCVKKESFRPISFRKLYPEWHEAYEKNKKPTA
ncbi:MULTISPECIES: thioesterase family protein [unclassified Bacillus (in: firmicutes)]|uniref:acyl-CoA thioesterase n=1 Tax=unclassified Bacillus (in: firmicutes) TaxID=185979 RepID=UPI0008E45B60|nr:MULTISPECIES: thioesterase family protein [unclassified Bacillus (in: firmicutes)]SFA89084.1 acyl-CoA thioester hydrolase [Bacillus sp. UNCCL13]SFQ84784.1 acyl-CoA thioester hydrolase [Bacillus sp. cl95]